MLKRQKITIVGSGYVGMSLGILLSQKHDVIILDIDESKVKKINSGSPTIKDQFIEKFLSENKMTIHATTDINEAYRNSKFIIIATPTNLDESSGNFDIDSVQKVIKDINEINKIKDELSQNFGSNVKLNYNYDPDLIGGLIMQVESVMIDTSIKNKLQQIENKMIEA